MNNAVNLNDPAPLYLQIKNALKNKIESGELHVGDQVGTQQELAAQFNVSLITVKKAIAELVAEGLLVSRVRKGTFVAEWQRKRKELSPHKTIGLVLRDVQHQFFSLIIHSVEERAYELGFNVLLSNSSGSIEKEENQISHFKRLGVDGLIIASLSFEYKATPFVQKLHDENFPYVMVSYIHDPDYWYVGTNHELGGYLATEHLLKLGYKSIGCLHIGKGNLLSEIRKNGYALALQEYDRPFDSHLIYYLAGNTTEIAADRYALGYKFGQRFISLDQKPDALFVYNDATALGLEHSLVEWGLSIPDDVAIVGFDDVMLAQYAPVPLTTIRQPTNRIGRAAVDVIQKRIEGSDVGNRTIFKPSLVVRDSCGARKRGDAPPSNVHSEEILN